MTKFTINPQKVLGTVDPRLYGLMVEHAYWSVHLGLCSQVIDNGGYELDRNRQNYKVAEGWKIYSTNPGNQFYSKLDDEKPYNGKHSQKIVIERYIGGEIRLQQSFIPLKKGVSYTGFIFLRGKMRNLTVELRTVTKDLAAQNQFTLDSTDWVKYDISLTPEVNSKDGAFCLSFAGEGEIWVDQLQLYPSDDYQGHRTRADVVNLYKDLLPPFVRWPGGTYLIWHHWKDAIGPLENRNYHDGRILNDKHGISHFGEWDPNTFGTDEFVQFCQDINSDPMININLKDGLQNTLDWIEYCNGDVDTKWGKKRAENGHPEPYKVKYWVVDNEPLASYQLKAFNPEIYPLLARRWAAEMKKKDPSIEVYIMGDNSLQEHVDKHPKFSEQVIRETGDVIDKLCVHLYYDQEIQASLQGMPYKTLKTIECLKKILDDNCHGRDVKVFLSEWNPESSTNIAGNMGQAIEAAQMYHIMERASAMGLMDMATMCQVCVNVDKYRGKWLRSAMVQLNSTEVWTSPMYHVTQIYSSLRQSELIDIQAHNNKMIKSNVFDGFTFPALDVIATSSADKNTVVLKCVNNSNDDIDAVFEMTNCIVESVEAQRVVAESILDMNTQFTPKNIIPGKLDTDWDRNVIQCKIKKYSVAAIKLTIRQN